MEEFEKIKLTRIIQTENGCKKINQKRNAFSNSLKFTSKHCMQIIIEFILNLLQIEFVSSHFQAP